MTHPSRYPRETYGNWAGNPKGRPYQPERCAYECFPIERDAMHHQCTRKRGHGKDGLFCSQHARLLERYGR